MARHLILRLEGPLMAFGGEIIDNHGIVDRFPALSLLTGLIGNALGWRREETGKLDRLQGRLVFAARRDRDGEPLRDFQTAELARDDKGWTTRGRPEGRAGGEGTYKGRHLRYRDYDADACVAVALRLDPAGEAPTLDDIAAALDRPARPLFLGRKPCLPATRILDGEIEAAGTLDALQRYRRLVPGRPKRGSDHPEPVPIRWPESDGTLDASQRLSVTDRRNWRSGPHGGSRWVREGQVDPPKSTGPS